MLIVVASLLVCLNLDLLFVIVLHYWIFFGGLSRGYMYLILGFHECRYRHLRQGALNHTGTNAKCLQLVVDYECHHESIVRRWLQMSTRSCLRNKRHLRMVSDYGRRHIRPPYRESLGWCVDLFLRRLGMWLYAPQVGSSWNKVTRVIFDTNDCVCMSCSCRRLLNRYTTTLSFY